MCKKLFGRRIYPIHRCSPESRLPRNFSPCSRSRHFWIYWVGVRGEIALSLGILPTYLLAFSPTTIMTFSIVKVVHGTKHVPYLGASWKQ
jgi:hypothetical protein